MQANNAKAVGEDHLMLCSSWVIADMQAEKARRCDARIPVPEY